MFNEKKDIHKFLDGGFIGNTEIKLSDGVVKQIKDIHVGDILENNESVYGIVEIDGRSLNSQYTYNLGNKIIEGGPNLTICDKTIQVSSTLNLNEIYDNYLDQSILFLSKKNSSALLQNLIGYCNTYASFFLLPLLNLALEILVLLFTICVLLYFNFTVTIICSLLLLTFSCIILLINKNKMIKYGSISNNQTILFIKNIQQTFSAIKDIKILGKESFFRKRSPADSKIDIKQSLKKNFNLLRICNNEKWPAFFYYKNQKYILKIYKG
jgi:hypothetical protein